MKTEHIVIGVLVLMLMSKRRPAPSVKERLNDPVVWGADIGTDQWAKIYGEDQLLAGGQHSAPSGYSIYGVQGGLGFNRP
jgi:hypothetical protein